MPAVVVIVAILGAGLVGAVAQSLEPTSLVGGTFSWAAWRSVLADPAFADALAFTVWTVLASTLLAAIGGVLLAALVRGAAPRVRLVVALPLAVPHLVVAVAVVAWLGPGGLVDRITGVDAGVVGDARGIGIILVSVLKEAPFVALAALAAWDDDTRRREEAATLLGAGPLIRLRLVALPRLAPAVAAASLVVAAFAVGAFEIATVVGPTTPETIATYALDQSRSPDPGASARAAAALLVAAALAAAAALTAGRLLRASDG